MMRPAVCLCGDSSGLVAAGSGVFFGSQEISTGPGDFSGRGSLPYGRVVI